VAKDCGFVIGHEVLNAIADCLEQMPRIALIGKPSAIRLAIAFRVVLTLPREVRQSD